LYLLGIYIEHNVKGIATGDEFWFQYSSYSDSLFAGARESVVPRIRRDISGRKTLLPICFPSRRLLVLKPLPKGTKFNLDYFIDGIFPGLYNEKTRISHKSNFPAFSVHMDNSMCHHGNKISKKLAKRSIEGAPHPHYSPDISSCDFWLSGMLKRKMKDREFQGQEAILRAIAESWNDLISEDIQRVFREWMERLTWVIGNNGEYYPN
jgi:hypothetical protein